MPFANRREEVVIAFRLRRHPLTGLLTRGKRNLNREVSAVRGEVLRLLFLAVDDVNQYLPEKCRLVRSEHASITGPDATLDSLGFLNLILTAENLVNQKLNARVHVASALLEENAEPPRTLGEFADLIVGQIETS